MEVPELTGEKPFIFRRLPLYDLKHEQRQFGYTLSMWIRNYGNHTYSSDVKEGRENHHLFEKGDSFALFWDSPISFRVYIYARDNINEFYTSPISVPLRDWVNI